jgi:hypothetical protein
MELRHHPSMCRHGISNWPPIWTQARKDNNKRVRGEFGVLRYVHSTRFANKCYLVIEYNAEHYVGSLIFDDVSFCWQISNMLNNYIGEAVKDIGSLDVSHTL